MFELLVTIVPVIVIGGFVFIIGKRLAETVSNVGQPVIDRRAVVVSRRQNSSHSSHAGAGYHRHHSCSTTYCVTFQFEDGGREELRVSGRQNGMLAEGDRGTLHSQGT